MEDVTQGQINKYARWWGADENDTEHYLTFTDICNVIYWDMAPDYGYNLRVLIMS